MKGTNSKKIVSGILATSMLISLAPATVFAATPTEAGSSQISTSVQAAARDSDEHSVYVEKNNGGFVQVHPSSAVEGETVTVTVTRNYGYKLEDIKVMRNSTVKLDLKQTNEGTYTFTMPDAPVTVNVEFAKRTLTDSGTVTGPTIIPGGGTTGGLTGGTTGGSSYPNYTPYPDQGEIPFRDVVRNAWYYDAVKYCYDNNLMVGVSSTLFSPNTIVTRAMVCAVLCNLEGGSYSGRQIYWDVPQGEWYSEAINWATTVGVVDGYGNGGFGPDDNVTREQLVAMLNKYALYKGYDTSRRVDLSVYRDNWAISSWARETVSWAIASDIMTGISYHTLNPQGTASRADLAAMLMNFDIVY